MSTLSIVPREGYLETTIDGVAGYADRISFPPVVKEWNPNVEPFFSTAFTDSSYWAQAPNGYFDQLADGWARFERDWSSQTGQYNAYFRPFPDESIAEGDEFTLLVEFGDVTVTGSPALVVQSNATAQLNPTAGSTRLPRFAQGTSVLIPLTADAYAGKDRLVSLGVRLYGGNILAGDVRLSLYAGDYDGIYKPVLPAL